MKNSSESFFHVLVIGKNSSIVKSIVDEFPDWDFVSHRDLDQKDLNKYDKIFVFSWSKTSIEENISILTQIDLSRVVFISTIAVLSIARRRQWARYPNWKCLCENRVLEGGGKVIRVGIWDQSNLDFLPAIVPVTTPQILVSTMRESLKSDLRVFWPVILTQGSLSGLRFLLSNSFNHVAFSLPSFKILQAPFAFLCKIIGSKDYGYTHDCLQFFVNRVLVGFGAVGAAVSHELTQGRHAHAVVVSEADDIFLDQGGFRGLRIGQRKEGLANLWHGVSVESKANGEFRKKVPLFVKRTPAPRRAIIATVTSLDHTGSLLSIVIENSKIYDARVFANFIHLASGVVNNMKILQKATGLTAFFDDHEVGVIGTVSSDELKKAKLIARYLGFVSGRKVLKGKFDELEYMIDFRPSARSVFEVDAENMYNNRTEQVVRKIVSHFSFGLFNQAFFNKFGIALNVDEFSVVIQIEAQRSIFLNREGGLSRTRLPFSILDGICHELSKEFSTFKKHSEIRTFDAIHLHGGCSVSDLGDLSSLILEKRLFLHGNVFDGSSIGPFHSTCRMIEREREVIRNV